MMFYIVYLYFLFTLLLYVKTVFPCLIHLFFSFHLMHIHYELYYILYLPQQTIFNFVQSDRHWYKNHIEKLIIDYQNSLQC